MSASTSTSPSPGYSSRREPEIASDDATGTAVDLLARLLAAAEDGGRTGSVIEILIVQALALRARKDVPEALLSLDRAVALAEPEGYVRVFADEGPPMAALLRLAAGHRGGSGYLRLLLAATASPAARVPVDQPLIEPLSERELEVLRLLESDLAGPDIARELSVSLATVRTHTRNIYAKLGANSRSAAVRRAAELGLLSRSRGATRRVGLRRASRRGGRTRPQIISTLITCGDARSSHPPPRCPQ